MGSTFLLLVLSQVSMRVPAAEPKELSRAEAIATLSRRTAPWESRQAALHVLRSAPLTADELEALTQAAVTLPRSANCAAKRAASCVVIVDECVSPTGYLLLAVANAPTDRLVELAASVLASRRDQRDWPIARRVIAAAGDERAEAEALRLLSTGEYSCVGEGAGMLMGRPTLSAAAQQAITEQLARGTNGLSLASLLSGRAEPWARSLARRASRSASPDLRLGLVRGFRSFPSDEEGRALFADLARCDPSARVRREAMERAQAFKAQVANRTCPVSGWTIEGTTVTGPSGERVVLGTSGTVPAPDARCAARKDGPTPLGMVGGICVLGADYGEWGGQLFALNAKGKPEPVTAKLSFLNPRALLEVGPAEALVVSTLEHLFGSGGIGRLRLSQGRFGYQPWLDFSVLPTRWATSGGRVFVSFPSDELVAPCPSVGGPEVTVGIEPDGSGFLVEGAATRCLR